jgi:hypothetical protein
LASSITNAAHPGIINITAASAVAGSGYSFQQSNANGIRLGTDYYTTIVFYPQCQNSIVNLTSAKLGFQDVFTSGASTDALYWLITQNSTTTFNVTLVARNNSVQTSGTVFSIPCNRWHTAQIYVNSITLATGKIYDDTFTLINTQTVGANIPTTAGRETSSGVVTYVTGMRYAAYGTLGLIAYDYFDIGVNATMVR